MISPSRFQTELGGFCPSPQFFRVSRRSGVSAAVMDSRPLLKEQHGLPLIVAVHFAH